MKKIGILVLLVVATVFYSSCNEKVKATSKIKKENLEAAVKRDVATKKGEALVSFDKKEYDFGTVKEGDIVDVTFEVTNIGKVDLVISNARSTCGCTIPVWPKAPIKPGETKEVKAKFNTAGKPNKQSKSIVLTTNTARGREILKLKGNVMPKPQSNKPTSLKKLNLKKK